MIYRALAFAAFAATCLPVTCPAQEVRITNMADVGRTQWVDVALPITDGLHLPVLCRLDPQGFIAVKGEHVGLHSTMFHVLAQLRPRETITGTLTGVSADPAALGRFAMSDWIASDTLAAIPCPSMIMDGEEHRLQGVEFGLVEANAARQVFHLRGRFAGTPLVFDEWLYLYNRQDVLRFEATVTNSDPRTPELSQTFDLLWLEAGDLLQMDYGTLTHMGPRAVQTSVHWHPSFGRWVQVLSGRRTMGRGEQLFFSGSVLALVRGGHALRPISYSAGPMTTVISVGERIQTLRAASEPAVGVYTGWDGKWLAFGLVPEVPAGSQNGGWADADASAAAFRALTQTTRDLYAQRPRGLSLRAGSTGAQEDFGASKGSFAVTVGDPRLLHELWYSAYEVFARPFHYREADGAPLLARDHPGLRTWSQIVNCRTTQDTVGLDCPLPYSWPSDGWSAYDDQHRSQNNANALLALTGSHALRAVMKDLLEVDLTQEPNRIDSPRGEGRLMMAWANMLLLLDDPLDRANLYQHMSDRMDVALRTWPGRNFVGDPSRPIRVLGVGRDPTFLENGTQIPAIIVWEHSIATMGYFAAYRLTGDLRYRDMAAELSRMIVNHCIYQENGQWIACTAVRYLGGPDEGRALPASSYYTGSPDIHVGISFWTWIFPAVLICRQLHQDDPALVARCTAIVDGLGAPNAWQRSEWWAVLPR